MLSLDVATLPCCRDRLGEIACQAIRKTNPAHFEKRCLGDHDFHMSCCKECRNYIENHKIHPENARSLFRAPQFCRDKRSLAFCRRFKTNGLGKFSCSDAEFAIRVCRQSCGYCNDALYALENLPASCQ
uniref:ShKT domain-containing protein n=1 Tax=Steinernema glaseri TaxID=37863 RepID=A0A1I7ZHN7_9BILA